MKSLHALFLVTIMFVFINLGNPEQWWRFDFEKTATIFLFLILAHTTYQRLKSSEGEKGVEDAK